MHDSMLHVLVMLAQFVVGLATFSIVYMLTGRPLSSLISAVLVMLATTVFWMWEVARD